MTQKRLLSFSALTFLTVLSLSVLWEFALEDVIEPVFQPNHRLENLSERWESVIVSVGLIALALVVPTWLALKSNLARQQTQEALRRAHDSMELQVEERTSGLRQANEQLGREIADRKKVEEKLRRSEERLRLLTDALPVLISYVDKDLRYQFSSRAYEIWFGASREDIRGRYVREVLGDTAYEILREYIDRVLMGELVHYESRAPYKDGGERDIRGTYVPDFGQDGTVKGFYVLVEDITESKRLEQQILRSERLVTLGELTGTVSHELRNPLGTIRNSLMVMDAKTRDRGLGIEGALDRAMRSISRCNGIIEDLFEYATCRTVTLQDTSLDAWLTEVLDDLAVPEGVTVRRALAADDTTVPMDRERMRRAIINLYDNACQAMAEEEDKERTLTIGTEAVGNEAKVSVADTGTGMSKDTVAQIFEPLFSTKIFGVGLGLPIVKQIIKQHDSKLEVTSEEGRGTRFVLRLPMVRAGGEAS